MLRLILILVLVCLPVSASTGSIQWTSTQNGIPSYNPNGFNYSEHGISYSVSRVENMMPGERHYLYCTQGKKVLVDRTLHCDKLQVEDYIEIENFFLGCVTR